VLREVQTTPAQTEWTPVAFIEKVLNEEENLVHIETMALEQTDTAQPEEEIPRLNPDSDNDDPKKRPQGESDLMAENGNPWLGTPDRDDLIIDYVRGEPVIGIFKPEQNPFTEEYFGPWIGYSWSEKWINRIIKAQGSACYCHGQSVWIREKTSISQSLEHASGKDKLETKKSLNKLLPGPYQEYCWLFEKAASEWFPESQPWDHVIDLKPDFITKDCKVYPLTPTEQKKLNEFLNDNLQKGYIRPLKSPMASPFFFVLKKDADALWTCQDYQYLNDGIIKNNYPLPLVGDLVDKLWGAKWFTKLDIWWGYHNIQIKEGDEWKGTFKTNKGLFKPMVMFFGLCNLLATFQNMMMTSSEIC